MRRPIFPAYGRELMRKRQAGLHPDAEHLMLVAVGFWPWLGDGAKQWPRDYALVVLDDMQLARLELRMLAGLAPLVVCDASRRSRAVDLVAALAQVEPQRGAVFLLDVDAAEYFECARWIEELGERAPQQKRDFLALFSPMVHRQQDNDRSAA